MKLWTNLVALILIVGLAGVAEAKKDKGSDLKGQITAVDGMKLTITSGKKKKAQMVDVTCDDKTAVTRDGQPAKVADLKSGDYVSVMPAIGTPTTITATTTAPEKKAK